MDYYDLFSFSAKKAIYRASEICMQFSNQYVEPEHIFYSVLNLRSCSAVQVLHQLEISLPKLTYSLEAYLYEHAEDYKVQPSFSARMLQLLDAAFKEVKSLHHREIGTTHLLIALGHDRSSFLHGLFKDHGLDARRVRDTFMKHLRGFTTGQSTSDPSEPAGMPAWNFQPESITQAIIAEAERQARSWHHNAVEPLHLLAAVLHLFPDSDFTRSLLHGAKPADMLALLLRAVRPVEAVSDIYIPLSERSIEVLVDGLRRSLRLRKTRVDWTQFCEALLSSFTDAERLLVYAFSSEPEATEPPPLNGENV